MGQIKENCSKIYSLEVNQENSRLFYGAFDHSIKVYDLENQLVLKSLKGHLNYIWTLVLSSDQAYLLTGGNDCKVIVWDARNNFDLMYSLDHGTSVLALSLCSLNNYIYCAGSRYQPVKRFNMKKKLQSPQFSFKKTASSKKKSSKNPFSFFKKNKKNKVKLSIPKKMKKNAKFKKLVEMHKDWMEEMDPQDKVNVKAILASLAEEQSKNSQIKVRQTDLSNANTVLKQQQAYMEQKEKKLVAQLGEYESKQSRFSMEYQSLRQKNKDFGLELVEMIKKYNTALAEKRVATQALTKMTEDLERQSEVSGRQQPVIARLKRENEELRDKLKKLMSAKLEITSNDLARISENTNKLLQMKTIELEGKVASLTSALEKKDHDLKFYQDILKNFKSEKTELKDQLEKAMDGRVLAGLSEKTNDQFLQKLVEVMEGHVRQVRTEKDKLEKKNQLLTREFYNVRNMCNSQKKRISRLVRQKQNIQDQVRLFRFQNEQLQEDVNQMRRLVTENTSHAQRVSMSRDSNIRSIVREILDEDSILDSRLRTSQSLPIKKKKIKYQTAKPVNVYINNHILEGENRQQSIRIGHSQNEPEFKKTIKNNFNPNTWNDD